MGRYSALNMTFHVHYYQYSPIQPWGLILPDYDTESINYHTEGCQKDVNQKGNL